MTAVKQTYSRDYKIAIDTLVVGCEVMNFDPTAVKSSPKDGKFQETTRSWAVVGVGTHSLSNQSNPTPTQVYISTAYSWKEHASTVNK